MAGDDAAAKVVVAGLRGALGFAALDAGDPRQARFVEPFAMVWIEQAMRRGAGRDWALTITKKDR